MPLRIEDYALIRDFETAALVGKHGSIVWLCWLRFDSAACLATLLGGPERGRWIIASRDPEARGAKGGTLREIRVVKYGAGVLRKN